MCFCVFCTFKKRTNDDNRKTVWRENNTQPPEADNNPSYPISPPIAEQKFESNEIHENKDNTTQNKHDLPYPIESVPVPQSQETAPSAPSENLVMGMPAIPPPSYPGGTGYSLTPPPVNQVHTAV